MGEQEGRVEIHLDDTQPLHRVVVRDGRERPQQAGVVKETVETAQLRRDIFRQLPVVVRRRAFQIHRVDGRLRPTGGDDFVVHGLQLGRGAPEEDDGRAVGGEGR